MTVRSDEDDGGAIVETRRFSRSRLVACLPLLATLLRSTRDCSCASARVAYTLVSPARHIHLLSLLSPRRLLSLSRLSHDSTRMSTPTARSTIDSHLDPLLAPPPPPPLSSSSSAPLSFKRRGTSNSGTSTPTGRPGMGAKAVSMLGGLLSGTSPSSSSAQRDPADPERDLIPQSRVPPSHQQQQQEHLPRTRRRDARLSHRPSESDFSQAVTARSETGSDDDDNDDDAEEEEDEEEDRTHSTISALGIGRGWRKRGPERSSFGASGGAGGGGKNARRASSVQFLSPRRPSRGGVGLGRHGGTNGGGGGGGAGDEAEYASAAGGGGGEQAAVAVTPLPVIPILVLCVSPLSSLEIP